MKLEPLKKRAEEYAARILAGAVAVDNLFYDEQHLMLAEAYYRGFIDCKEESVAVVNGQLKTIVKNDTAQFVVNRIWHGLVKLGEK